MPFNNDFMFIEFERLEKKYKCIHLLFVLNIILFEYEIDETMLKICITCIVNF